MRVHTLKRQVQSTLEAFAAVRIAAEPAEGGPRLDLLSGLRRGRFSQRTVKMKMQVRLRFLYSPFESTYWYFGNAMHESARARCSLQRAQSEGRSSPKVAHGFSFFLRIPLASGVS